MRNTFLSRDDKSWRFWLIAVFVILVMLLGGGSGPDNQTFILLRPVSIIICCIALWSIKREHVVPYKVLFIFAVAFFAMVGVQLIPLPPEIWSALPGRELEAQIDKAAGIAPVWRPISLVPSMTWNALYSLFIPLAALLMGIQLTRNERRKLLVVIIILGILGGLVGLLQVIGDPTGPLYFYSFTNNGSAVGFFANRNHQAFLLSCLFPMLAVFASIDVKSRESHRIRLMIAGGAGILLVPLLLVTGSRMGILVGIIGLFSIPFLYKNPVAGLNEKRRGRRFTPAYAVGAFGVFILVLLTVVFSRAQALQRLVTDEDNQDLRFQVWGPIIEQGWKYFPFGAGAGAFAQAYQTGERNELLYPNYVNLAHNDFIEVFFSFGLIGVGLIAAALILWAMASYKIWRLPSDKRPSTLVGRMASVIMLILAVASISDYPLRDPSMMVLWTVCCLWMVDALKTSDQRLVNNLE
jgi:O-antigen ligase